MSVAKVAIEHRTVTVFTTLMLLLAGVASFFTLGQLEDPAFTVKTAAIVTSYPGASPEEVELEVTDRIEIAIQEMPQIKEVESFSRAGVSVVKAYIRPSFDSSEMPQIWDELRKKIRDASGSLPPGAGKPMVADDFGDVYGFLLAITGDGFTYAELQKYVDAVKKELSVVEGVSRVELWGQQTEAIFVEISETRLGALGLTPLDLRMILTQQNVVTDAGGIDVGESRLRFEATGEFQSPEEIGDLVIRGATPGVSAGSSELIRLRDIAEVRRGFIEPPVWEMRSNGETSIGLAISNVPGSNIVTLGERLGARLAELEADYPIGIEFRRVSWQSEQVDESIKTFLISLLEAVLIVLVVLWIAMGLRIAMIIGLCGLVFTIVLTLLAMAGAGIDLQRMSLGALVIAMGMMVDNAIVVVDGISVRIQSGMDRVKAATEAATEPSMPLLGATIVAVLAFYPIFASEESAGEYCSTLFSVVGISLMISWVLSVTITPVVCIWLLPAPKENAGDPYAGRMYGLFRGVLRLAIKLRWGVMLVFIAMLVGSGLAFGFVNQLFFPSSARRQFMVDYWAPEGTRVQQTSRDLRQLETHIADLDGVTMVTTFVGQGPPRFYLPVEPESPYSSYGQLIINTETSADVVRLIDELQPWVIDNVPQARVVIRKYGLGPSETWPVQLRYSGPAVADAAVLRDLAERTEAIIAKSPHASIVRSDWRQRVPKIVADYDQENARWTSITRTNIADATRRSFDGVTVGLFRESDKLLPIVVRNPEEERARAARGLDLLQVRPASQARSVPLSQVTDSIDLEWEDPLIWRMDRRRSITVQALPTELATTLRDDIVEEVEAMELPRGYTRVWDGEFRSSNDAKASLVPGVIPAVGIMAIIIVALFNAFRQPVIIALVIPFALIGVVVGLLATGQPFGFVALLGAMSLAGMMIKNAIVLLDQAKIERANGSDHFDAIVAAAVSRLRPVVLAAGTTVLGVIPLLQDVFWVAMAVTIMFGLAFGTVLTMLVIPVLYAILFRVRVPPR